MKPRLILARHPLVTAAIRGVCYGRSDIELSPEGFDSIPELAARLAAHSPDLVYHSDLERTSVLAETVACLADTFPVADARLRELDYGEWEGRSWDEIYATTANAMDGFLTHPDSWCPPGGETTFAMRDRMLDWYRGLPADKIVVAVSHAGPIAALVGTLRGLPVTEWHEIQIGQGEIFCLE